MAFPGRRRGFEFISNEGRPVQMAFTPRGSQRCEERLPGSIQALIKNAVCFDVVVTGNLCGFYLLAPPYLCIDLDIARCINPCHAEL